jgi:hypothetical protein
VLGPDAPQAIGLRRRCRDERRDVVASSSAARISSAARMGVDELLGRRSRVVLDLVTAAFPRAVALQMWQVFSVDFTRYPTDWSVLACVAFGVVTAATSLAIITNLVTGRHADG